MHFWCRAIPSDWHKTPASCPTWVFAETLRHERRVGDMRAINESYTAILSRLCHM